MDLATLVADYEGSKVPEFIRAYFWGNPGTGKTTLAATFPEPLFINADQGMSSVVKDIRTIDVGKEIDRPYELIVQVLVDASVKRGIFAPGQYADGVKTIIFDSMTTLGDAMLTQIMVENKLDPLKDKPTFDEWGILQRKMVEVSKRVKDLSGKYNVIQTAWATVKENEDTKIVSAFPMLPGSYRERASGDVDESYYMEGRTGPDGFEVTLYASPKGIYHAKTRLLADTKITNPSYEKLLASMKKKRAANKSS
jgi:hypothetical protein